MTTIPRARAGNGLIPALRGAGLMFDEPRPLVFSETKLVVAWSPKSACTHVLTWFLAQEGLVRAAEYFDPWAHEYRGKVYYRCLRYREAATQFLDADAAGYTLLKVTRAPHQRLVSVFRHALRNRLLQAELDAQFGRETARTGVTLREFGAVLEGCDLVNPSAMNFHLCAQYHPVWDMGFDRIVTLNMDETPLDAGLAAVEKAFGLPAQQVTDHEYFNRMRARHYAKDVPYEGKGPIEDARLGADSGAGFPKSALERAPFLRALAERLHKADTGRVATGDTAGQLFG